MDWDAAAGHVPAVLCPCQHAHLHHLHEPGLRLEQERSRHCAQQLLLGLLPDSDPGWPLGGPVTACSPLLAGLESSWGRAYWELGEPRPRELGCTAIPLGAQYPSESSWGSGMDGRTGPLASSAEGCGSVRLWRTAPRRDGPSPTWLPYHCPLGPSRIGGEKVILLSASAWGFLTAATPLLAHLGSAHLVFMTFSRILTGLLQGRHPSLTGGGRLCHGAYVWSMVHVCVFM